MADEKREEKPIEHPSYRDAVIAKVAPGIDPVVQQQHADWMYGNVDTSDTADLVQNQVMAVSPAFALHRRNAAVQAARALDPTDPGVSRRAVVLPQDHQQAEEAQEQIRAAADFAVANPLVVGGSVVDGPLNLGGPVGQESARTEDDEEKDSDLVREDRVQSAEPTEPSTGKEEEDAGPSA